MPPHRHVYSFLCFSHSFCYFQWFNIQEVQSLAKKAAETVVSVIDEEGVESLLSELLKGVGDNQARSFFILLIL